MKGSRAFEITFEVNDESDAGQALADAGANDPASARRILGDMLELHLRMALDRYNAERRSVTLTLGGA